MNKKFSFIDENGIARDFVTGDLVRKVTNRDNLLTPFLGKVLFSNPSTGRVHVQWPWGDEQESAVELIRDYGVSFSPTNLNQSYDTWESSRYTDGEKIEKENSKWTKTLSSIIVSEYEKTTLPLWKLAARLYYRGNDDISTFFKVSSVYGSMYSDDAIRITISNIFEHGKRLSIYWKDKKRRYRVTQQEKSSNKLSCPRCKSLLRPRTYRQKQRLLSCKVCGFSIHPRDLLV